LTSQPNQVQIKPLGDRRQRISTTFETQPSSRQGPPRCHANKPSQLRCSAAASTVAADVSRQRRIEAARLVAAKVGVADRANRSDRQAFGGDPDAD